MKPERADFEINQRDFVASEKAWPDMQQHGNGRFFMSLMASISLIVSSICGLSPLYRNSRRPLRFDGSFITILPKDFAHHNARCKSLPIP
jgi:hypothetical protein